MSAKPMPRRPSRSWTTTASSSPVASRSVEKRQCSTSSAPSKAPRWVWVLPTSIASSIAAIMPVRPPARRPGSTRWPGASAASASPSVLPSGSASSGASSSSGTSTKRRLRELRMRAATRPVRLEHRGLRPAAGRRRSAAARAARPPPCGPARARSRLQAASSSRGSRSVSTRRPRCRSRAGRAPRPRAPSRRRTSAPRTSIAVVRVEQLDAARRFASRSPTFDPSPR